ncbi:unnamed protein product, partial [Rotaria magnacalcarata]
FFKACVPLRHDESTPKLFATDDHKCRSFTLSHPPCVTTLVYNACKSTTCPAMVGKHRNVVLQTDIRIRMICYST